MELRSLDGWLHARYAGVTVSTMCLSLASMSPYILLLHHSLSSPLHVVYNVGRTTILHFLLCFSFLENVAMVMVGWQLLGTFPLGCMI